MWGIIFLLQGHGPKQHEQGGITQIPQPTEPQSEISSSGWDPKVAVGSQALLSLSERHQYSRGWFQCVQRSLSKVPGVNLNKYKVRVTKCLKTILPIQPSVLLCVLSASSTWSSTYTFEWLFTAKCLCIDSRTSTTLLENVSYFDIFIALTNIIGSALPSIDSLSMSYCNCTFNTSSNAVTIITIISSMQWWDTTRRNSHDTHDYITAILWPFSICAICQV